MHEIVYKLVHYWDDVVFEECPTWEDCVGAAKFSGPKLEEYFGPAAGDGRNPAGKANYAQCVQYGIGRAVIAKMLEGTATPAAIEEALLSFPMTNRHRLGAELQIQADLERAEEHRAKQEATAATFAETRAANRRKSIVDRDWYDARASKVFDRSQHSRVFR